MESFVEMMKAHVVNIDVLGMSLIFTDFNIAHGLKPLPVGKSVNIRAIPRYTGKIPT